jgi:hypothetical protein
LAAPRARHRRGRPAQEPRRDWCRDCSDRGRDVALAPCRQRRRASAVSAGRAQMMRRLNGPPSRRAVERSRAERRRGAGGCKLRVSSSSLSASMRPTRRQVVQLL